MVSYASQFRLHAVSYEATMSKEEQKSFVERITREIDNLSEIEISSE